MKLSLGKDFFGRTYDRLSPSADRSPKWYCERCSMHKNLQRDFRDIQEEVTRWTSGESSELTSPEQVNRIQLRLREMSVLVDKDTVDPSFVSRDELDGLIRKVEGRAGSAHP